MSPAKLPTRQLGKNGPQVTAIGFGAMGLSAFFGRYGTDEERLAVFDHAYEIGETNWDSAAVYGDSEVLIGKWFKRTGKRDEIFLATKFTYPDDLPLGTSYEENRLHVFAAADKALGRLGISTIDLFYLHRISTKVPIEHTMLAFLELRAAGKIKYFGLSECSTACLRRAEAVAHVDAVQLEYSPYALEIETPEVGLLDACRELGVAIVAYSPLGRGLFARKFESTDGLDEDDFRRTVPKLNGEHVTRNLQLAKRIEEFAVRKGVTAAQLTLAWLLAQGEEIIPIPGTKRAHILSENVKALEVTITPEDDKEIRAIINEVGTSGDRYDSNMLSTCLIDGAPISEEEKQATIEKAKAFQ